MGLIFFWLIIFVLLPNIAVIVASALTREETNFIALPFTWENYLKIIDPDYLHVFFQSLLYATGTTLICILLGYPFAYALSKVKPGWRNICLLLVIIPFWTNSLIRTYAIKIIFANNGLLNSALLKLGLIEKPLTILYTHYAVLIGLVYILLPFMILPLYAVIEKLDLRLNEAARDLGANRWQAFWYVTLPLTMPGIVAGSLLVFLPALGMFFVSDVLGGAKELLIGNLIKNQFLDARDWPFGSALSTVVTLIMAVMLYLYYLSSRLINRTFSEGGRHL
ncbi:MAG TPA: spermidine/putrescine ABC transporter permease PotB [Pseudomonadales bacterium]|nr:spermidine/putrescine ABC transporter permease PotB [Pseudomonadales bacterium]